MKITLWYFLILIGCFHSVAGANESCNGIWMDDSYSSTLKRSLSPKAAFAVSDIPIIRVDMPTQSIGMVYHFHELLEETIENIDPQSGEILVSNRHRMIQSISCADTHLQVSYTTSDARTVTATFSRISSDVENLHQQIYRYVAQLLLAAEYRDADNNTYRFTPTDATWDGRHFSYMIFLDFVEFTPIDILCEIDERGRCHKIFGFATNGGMLQIYEYDDDVKAIGKLLLDLRKA